MEDGGPPYRFPIHRHTRHPKRTHSEVERSYSMERAYSRSESPLFVPQDAHHRDASPHAPYHPRLALPPRPPQVPTRYPGDGLDYRRPVSNMSNRNMHVIDLTDDDDASTPSTHATPQPEPVASASRAQRLPRYNREIIDLSADASPTATRTQQNPPPNEPAPVPAPAPVEHPAEPNPTHEARASPEIQFISERPLSRSQRPPTLPREAPRAPGPLAVDLTHDLDDDVVHVRTEERAGVNMLEPQGQFDFDGRFGGLGRLTARLLGPPRRRLQGIAMGGQQHIPPWLRDDDEHTFLFAAPARRPGNIPNVRMDYQTVAFELGLPDQQAFAEIDIVRPPSPPKYEAPSPVREPFTRSPEEGESLVCPNCKHELAMGDTEEKRQVWIVKACGHVYCGDCMINRKKQRSQKGKGRAGEQPRPDPFSACRVTGCGVRVSHPRDVMQIFL